MDAPIIVSTVALLISGISAFMAYRSSNAARTSADTAKKAYREHFRPIITARVGAHSAENKAIAFDLLVENTGNRAAMDVRLTAGKNQLDEVLTGGPNDALVQDVRKCFSTIIPVLAPGQSVSNSFGVLTGPSQVSTWRSYHTILPIHVSYKDLEDPGRDFRHDQALVVGLEEAFAGGRWGRSD